MSFRRFVYLITNDSKWRDFPLYRINTSRLFFLGTHVSDPPPAKQAPLPSPDFRFRPPVSQYVNGSMGFVLFSGGENQSHHQVLATDQTGRAVLCDPETRSVRTLPSLAAPKEKPVSFSVGNDLYILDAVLSYTTSGSCYHCFDGLVFGVDRSTQSHDDWYCHALPPPPYVHEYNGHPYASRTAAAHVHSYALVGGAGAGARGGGSGKIWISKKTVGTHSFDVARSAWTKVGNWALPFSGRAHYLPEHGLWFGLSSSYRDGDDALVCASDLTVAPPTPVDLWKDQTPAEWTSRSSCLVHLGCSRFCLARFFEIEFPPPDELCSIKYVVFSGLEVQRRGRELRVVKHMSEQYRLFHKLFHWVL